MRKTDKIMTLTCTAVSDRTLDQENHYVEIEKKSNLQHRLISGLQLSNT